MRQLFLMLSIIACVAIPLGQAASRPNFNGTWSVFDVRDASRTLIVSHHGSKLLVTKRQFAGAVTSTTRSLYYIDGKTHFTRETSLVSSRNEAIAKKPSSTTLKSIASWNDNTPVILRDGEDKEEWELSEEGSRLIVTAGTTMHVYRKTGPPRGIL